MENISPMRFVLAFLEVVENYGIFDEFDAEQNKMVTSEPVKDLIEMARLIAPEEIDNHEAAARMRELSDAERDFLVENDDEGVVVDMRDYFHKEMARNNGARGVLMQLHYARQSGDKEEINRLLKLATEFTLREGE